MADFSLAFEGEGGLIRAAGLIMRIVARALRVHEVKVKIIHAAGLELAFEERADVLLLFEEVPRELVRQDVALARIAARETCADGQLAFAVDIAVGRVEIVEAARKEQVRHPFDLLDIHLFAEHRQTHAAEAEIAFDLFHTNHPSVSIIWIAPVFCKEKSRVCLTQILQNVILFLSKRLVFFCRSINSSRQRGCGNASDRSL